MESSADNYIISYTSIIVELDKAILFNCDGDEVWLPISQIIVDRTNEKIELPEWLFKEKFPNG